MKRDPILQLTAWVPIACYVIVTAFALYALMTFGQWPVYDHPEPHDVASQRFYRLATSGALIGLSCVIVVPLIGFGCAAWHRKRGAAPKRLG